MGGSVSKQLPVPPPSALLPEHWRIIEWGKRDEMKEHLRRFQISNPDVEQLRILVHGPVGAGRSSFINSIDSIFQERMTSGAIVEAISSHSCTKRFRAHQIKDGRYGSYLPFAMCDVMGLESGNSAGVLTDDLMNILEGHIKDDYVCNPTSACSEKDKGYNKDPDLKDNIHCLVSVIPADICLWYADKRKVSDNTTRDTDDVINKFRTVSDHADMLGIPQVIILSKVDKACSKVTEDVGMIYRSTMIQKKIRYCSSTVGVPMNYIFPVKNYHEEIHLNNNMDVLLLSALTTILNFANEYVSGRRKRRSFPNRSWGFSQYEEPLRTDSHTCEFKLEELRTGVQTSRNARPQYAESEL